MKKIKNNTDLYAQKMRLRVRELELERSIHHDWSALKEKLQLKNILKNKLAGEKKDEMAEDKHWLVSGLSIGASILTRKIIDNAGDKIGYKVEKGMDSFLSKVQGILSRRKKRKE